MKRLIVIAAMAAILVSGTRPGMSQQAGHRRVNDTFTPVAIPSNAFASQSGATTPSAQRRYFQSPRGPATPVAQPTYAHPAQPTYAHPAYAQPAYAPAASRPLHARPGAQSNYAPSAQTPHPAFVRRRIYLPQPVPPRPASGYGSAPGQPTYVRSQEAPAPLLTPPNAPIREPRSPSDLRPPQPAPASPSDLPAPQAERAAPAQPAFDPYAATPEQGFPAYAPFCPAEQGAGFMQRRHWSGPTYGDGHVGETAVECGPPPRSPWFASVDALLMTRDNENEVWFSYDTADITSQIMGSIDADMGWEFGYDFRIGRYFHEGRTSIEAVYWALRPTVEEANAYGAAMTGGLDTSLRFDNLNYNPGGGPVTVSSVFLNAERHRLRRSYEIHNFEANLWRHSVCPTAKCDAPRTRLSWTAGARYFSFSEGFEFATDPANTTFGDNLVDELYYEVEAQNHLIGFQLGGMGEWCVGERWQLTGAVKAGLYANYITHSSFIGSKTGTAFVSLGGSPYNNQPFNVSCGKTDAAFLGELDLGARYRLRKHFNITGGYRVMGVSGVALATNQVPYYFANLGGVEHTDDNGHLILHGAYYIGGEYNY